MTGKDEDAAAAKAAAAAAAATAAENLRATEHVEKLLRLIRTAKIADEEVLKELETGNNINLLERNVLNLKSLVVEMDEELLLDCPVNVVTNLKNQITQCRTTIVNVERTIRFAHHLKPVQSTGQNITQSDHEVKITWNPVHFKGDLKEWIAWWDLFRTSIHENKKYSDATKVKCLIECLQGPAALAIKSHAAVSENYQKIVDSLLDTYNNPSALESIYIEDMNRIKEATDAKSGRQNINQIKGLLNNLSMLSGKVNTDSTQLRKIILNKFPEALLEKAVHRVNRATGGKFTYTPSQLINELDELVATREHIALNRDSPIRIQETTNLLIHNVNNAPPQKRPREDAKTITCLFCGNRHHAAVCRTYPTLERRRQKLIELKRCFRCTGPNHNANECKIRNLKCDNCPKTDHVTTMCPSNNANAASTSKRAKTSNVYFHSYVFIQTVLCILFNNETAEEVEVRCLLDNGSKTSYILDELITRLNLPIVRNVNLNCMRFREISPISVESAELFISLKNDHNDIIKLRVFSTPNIVGSFEPPPKEIVDKFPKHLKYADNYQNSKISILIGSDMYYNVVDPRKCISLNDGILLKSIFGWVPAGKFSYGDIQSNSSLTLFTTSTTSESNSGNDIDFSKLWSLETLGIEDPAKSISIEQILQNFKNTTYRNNDGRYVVRFPWKSEKIDLKSNFRIALGRLNSLLNTTDIDTLNLGEKYFKELLDLKIIEFAPPSIDLIESNAPKRIHYLPHSWLFQKDKLRVVFDASAKMKSGESLNDKIHPGPNLVESSTGILVNFRLGVIALSADIEKAFLQIVLNELDRDATRFLWVKDTTKPATRDNLVYLRFARVPFGVNASPFLLNIVIKDYLSKNPEKSILIRNLHNFYVDNFITSVNDVTDALQISMTMKDELKTIGMNLRDWISNDERLMRAIPIESRMVGNTDVMTILGIEWNIKKDVLNCKLNSNLPTLGTKHNVLSFLASVYDPLGLFSPCLVELKLFLRDCWKLKFQWHEQLPELMQTRWVKLRDEILCLENISIPRHIGLNSKTTSYSIHVFCDASQKAYACCVYLICKNHATSEIISNLIFAKTRLAPKNNLTIPKLELLGVLIGKRSAEFIKSDFRHPIDTIVIWTDATTVLQWLHSMEVLPPFVQNRITELRKSSINEFRYIPTEENPADHASRGKTPFALKQVSNWWKGPTWIGFPSLWPSPPENVYTYAPNTKSFNEPIVTLVTNTNEQTVDPTIEELENKFQFATWSARVNLLKHLTKQDMRKAGLVPPTDPELYKSCEKKLIIALQQKHLKAEYDLLKMHKPVPSNLNLFLDDDNIIRCRGRLTFSKFPWETIHPILLPRNHPATEGIIREIHQQNGHVGASHVLGKFRERFWITRGRSIVKSVLHRCVTCRRWAGGSYELPPIPPLPEIRVTTVAPFLYVGTDYIGPFNATGQDGESILVQILVFTCLVTRAVHLELTPDLSGYQCYLAFLRFTSTRRVPHVIISDNASTFQFVQPIVGRNVQLADYKLNAFVENNRIAWHFIPAYTPWYGGAYERLNGLIKNSLKRSYGHKNLNFEEFRTVVIIVTDIVNSRPLTYISPDEPLQALTPNHFLKLGPTNINTDLGEPTMNTRITETGADLLKNWKYISNVLDAYWETFRREYLLSLRERHTISHPRKKGMSQFSPSVGDIVLIEEPNSPRADWPLGKIEKLDRRQALAHVRSKGKLVLRSIKHLYPLEVQCERETAPSPTTLAAELSTSTPQNEPSTRLLAITAGPSSSS